MKHDRIRFLMAVAATAATLCSQQTKTPGPAAAAPAADSPAAWLPLGACARWTWRMKFTPGSEVVKSAEAVKTVDLPGAACWELRDVQGAYQSWNYEGTKADGVYVWRNAYLGGMRGVDRSDPPRRVLAFPPKAGFVWTWTEEGSVQIHGDAEPPPADELRSHLRAEIEAIDDPVTVPAGTYAAARVRMTSTSRYFGSHEEVSWWARGVGLVKRERRTTSGESASSVQELVSFTPAPAEDGITPEDALAKFLGTPPKCPCGGVISCPEWISDRRITDWFRSRFTVFVCGTRTHLLRAHRGTVAPFDPADLPSWRRLLEDERISLAPERPGADDAPTAVAIAAALLSAWAADPGFVPGDGVRATHTSGEREWKVEASVHGQGSDGVRRTARAALSGSAGRLEALEAAAGDR